MFSFLALLNWIHQSLLFKFLLSSYHFFFTTPISTTTHDSILPNEIITDILLRLPTKSLLKCMSVSKSWHQLISSPDFVKNHLNLNTHQLLLFPGINGKYKFCSLPSLFNQQQELLQNMDPPTLKGFFVGSVNGLICLCNHQGEMYIWNPTIRKSKKLLLYSKWDNVTTPWSYIFYTEYGFGYDESTDSYKVVMVNYCHNSYYYDELFNMRTIVTIYNLRSDCWTTLHDQLQGILLITCSGKFINGKIYWDASKRIGNVNARNIISFDVADETWGSLELPISGEENSEFKLGVVGSDLSLLHTCHHLGIYTSDVWVLKDCSDISWMKLFTIEYHQNVVQHLFSSPMDAFSIHLCQSEKADILLSLPGLIMIFDGATKKLKHTTDVGRCNPAETYAESIVNPLTISEHQEIQEESTEEEYETEEDEEDEEEYETEEDEEDEEEYETEEHEEDEEEYETEEDEEDEEEYETDEHEEDEEEYETEEDEEEFKEEIDSD